MRIAGKVQSFLSYRLLEYRPAYVHPPKALLGILIGVLGLATTPALAQDPEPAPGVESWIEMLGDRDWHRRQRATETILETGPSVVPLLRARLESSDPEVAERIRWLLSILDPAVFEVAVLRLGHHGSAAEIREWIILKVTERNVAAGTTRNKDGKGTRLSLSVQALESHLRVLARRADEDLTRGAGQALRPGILAPLLREDRVEERREKARIHRVVQPSLWVLWLRRELVSREASVNLPDDPGTTLRPELEMVLVEQQRNADEGVRDDARQVVSFLRAPDLLQKPEQTDGPEGVRWLIARVRAGDHSAVPELESWVASEAADGSANAAKDDAALALAGAESAAGFDLMLKRLTELGPWKRYQSLRTINAFLESADVDPERVAQILNAVCDPESFAFLPWRTVETELMFQNLEEKAPGEMFADTWFPLLEEGLRENTPNLLSAQDTLLRSLWRLRARKLAPPEKWLQPVLRLFESRSFDSAFGLVREAYLAGDLSAEEWDATLDRITSTMAEKQTGNNFRTSEMIRVFTRTPGLTLDDIRRLWKARLQCYLIPESYARERIDRELDALFDPLEGKRPSRDDQEAWEKRLELRTAQIDAAPAELLQAGSTEEHRDFRLCEVDFRIDRDRREVTPIDFRQHTIRFGVSYPETGPDGRDRSILLTSLPNRRGPQSATQFMLGSGIRITLDQPVLVNTRSGYRFSSYLMSDSAYGRRSLPRNRTVLYKTLVLLEDARDAIPIRSWPELSSHVVNSGTVTQAGAHRDRWLDLIRELRLEEAKPALRKIYAESPTTPIARTLLSLGDPVGIASLREGIVNIRGRVPVKLVQELIEAGDRETIELAIEWVKSPPAKMKSYTYPLLDALERALWGPDPVVEIDEDVLFEALISALGDGRSLHRVVTLLRTRIGNDFGYYATLQIRDAAERKAAQSRVVERWNDWWKERQAADRPATASSED